MEEKLLIDSIIFDVDGTLWDSTDVVADAWNQILKKETDMTPNLTGAVLKGLFGRLLPDIAAVIFHEYPKERQLELIEACCAKEHEALLATPAPVYPGLVDALSILSRHYPLYIVSNCQAAISKFFWKPQASVTISKAISVLAIPERQRQTTSVQSSNRTICSTRSMSAIPTATTRRHTRPESRLSMPHTVLVRPKTRTTPSLPRWILSHCSYRKINF